MKKISWNDGYCNGGRTPRLYFLKNENFYRFSGHAIDGVCSCVEGHHTRNGKWSNSTYEITLPDSVGVLDLLPAIHNKQWQEMGTFEEVQAEIIRMSGQFVGLENVKAWIEKEYSQAYDRLKENEKVLSDMALEDEEPITVTFGKPTNAQRCAGFWHSPKDTPYGVVSLNQDKIETEYPNFPRKEIEGEWNRRAPLEAIECPEGVICVNLTRQPGMHGGYVTLHLRRVKKVE